MLILLNPFYIGKEEQLVLDDRTANIAAELIALKRQVCAAGGSGKPGTVVLEVVKQLPVKRVRTGARSNQYLSRGRYLTGHVLSRTIELEFIDRPGRRVEDRRADRFIGNVLTVQQNAGGAAGDTVQRNSRITGLGWIKTLSTLQDDARLNLRDVENVAPIDGQSFNLLTSHHAGNTGLVGVDLQRARVDLHSLGFAANS